MSIDSLRPGPYTFKFVKDDHVLGLSSGGGGGHEMAMKTIEAEFYEQNPNGSFQAIDVIKGSFPYPLNEIIAREAVSGWDDAKRRGDVQAQENLLKRKVLAVTLQRLADIILFIPVFISNFCRLAFNQIFSERKITIIVDTQPLATSAIFKVARLISLLFGTSIRVVMVMTDLPTSNAIHFAYPIKNLDPEDKKILLLCTTRPFLEHQKDDWDDKRVAIEEEVFWKEHFGLSLLSHVKYVDFPIRPAFKKWQNIPKENRPQKLLVKVNNEEEFSCMNDLLDGGLSKKKIKFGQPDNIKEVISVDNISEDDVVGLITIGSQAPSKTKDYVKNFIDIVREEGNPDKNYFFFVGCGKHTSNQNTLYRQIYNEIIQAKKSKNFPANLKVVLLGFQDDDELAPMMHRADFGVYGSGGLTSMEVNSVAKGIVFLHTEKQLLKDEWKSKTSEEILKELLTGFALWEGGNAKYQIKKKNAEVISPDIRFKASLFKKGIFKRKDPSCSKLSLSIPHQHIEGFSIQITA